VKIHAGILLSPVTCAAIGPALQDFLASWRTNGLQAPVDVRLEVGEVAELGRRYQAACLQKRAADVRSDRSDEHTLANACSPPAPSALVTYSTAEVAAALGIGCRAVQRRANRGSLRATRTPGGDLRFDKVQVDRLAKGRTPHG
jgi:excisionase family DNA binding protein